MTFSSSNVSPPCAPASWPLKPGEMQWWLKTMAWNPAQGYSLVLGKSSNYKKHRKSGVFQGVAHLQSFTLRCSPRSSQCAVNLLASCTLFSLLFTHPERTCLQMCVFQEIYWLDFKWTSSASTDPDLSCRRSLPPISQCPIPQRYWQKDSHCFLQI